MAISAGPNFFFYLVDRIFFFLQKYADIRTRNHLFHSLIVNRLLVTLTRNREDGIHLLYMLLPCDSPFASTSLFRQTKSLRSILLFTIHELSGFFSAIEISALRAIESQGSFSAFAIASWCIVVFLWSLILLTRRFFTLTNEGMFVVCCLNFPWPPVHTQWYMTNRSLSLCFHHIRRPWGPGGLSRECAPPYPQRDRKRRLNGAVCRNHRIKRLVPCRC